VTNMKSSILPEFPRLLGEDPEALHNFIKDPDEKTNQDFEKIAKEIITSIEAEKSVESLNKVTRFVN